jgi:hypothetical protein
VFSTTTEMGSGNIARGSKLNQRGCPCLIEGIRGKDDIDLKWRKCHDIRGAHHALVDVGERILCEKRVVKRRPGGAREGA